MPAKKKTNQTRNKAGTPFLYKVTEGSRVVCPECKATFLPLPVEPVFTLAMSSTIIPVSLATLKNWLSKRPAEFPARYISEGRVKRQVRVLTASEIQTFRSEAVHARKPGAWGKKDAPV